MKNWKKKWEDELNNSVPAMSETLKNEPINVACSQESNSSALQKTNVTEPWYTRLFSSPKRIVALASACGVCALTLGLSLYFGGKSNEDGGITASAASGAVCVRINPEAVFSVDGEGNVLSIAAMNTDADVILSNSARVERMKGKPVADAVKTFVDYAAQLGYLDLSAPDALQIASCIDEEAAKIIGACLEDYFCEKGAYIVVVEESMTVADFATHIGLENIDSTTKLTENIQQLTTPYFERHADKNGDKSFEELYNEQIEKTEIEEAFQHLIAENVDKIYQNIVDIQAIAAQEELIRTHKDNPLAFLGGADYWTLCHSREKEYTPDFREEMKKMDELLLDYERTYGRRIMGLMDLQKALKECEALPIDILEEISSNFTTELFERYFLILNDLFKNIGVDVSHLTRIYETPADKKGYTEKMQEYVTSRYDVLEGRGKEKYEEKRDVIDKKDYGEYVQGLIDEFGSLEEYWKSLDKKN